LASVSPGDDEAGASVVEFDALKSLNEQVHRDE